MEVIRYRAWIKDYVMVAEVKFMNLKNKEIVATIEGEEYEFNCGEYELMQYTGLKDKNGAEIYEGDILDGSYSNPLTKKVVKKYYQVAYENGCYNAHAKNHPFGSTVLYFINTKSEVIGNIYENPELLEHGGD